MIPKHIQNLVLIHQIRYELEPCNRRLFDFYIEELSGNTLHTHIDNGVVYYSLKSTPLKHIL